MPLLIARYQIRPQHLPELADGLTTVFAELAADPPAGFDYLMGVHPDESTVLGLVRLDDGVENPLLGLPAAKDLRERLPAWTVEPPPAPEPLRVLGVHGFGH